MENNDNDNFVTLLADSTFNLSICLKIIEIFLKK